MRGRRRGGGVARADDAATSCCHKPLLSCRNRSCHDLHTRAAALVGDGDAILFAHGFLGSVYDFAHAAEALASDGFTVVAPELPESLCASSFSIKAVHMAEGLYRARHPGRMEVHPAQVDRSGLQWPRVLLDGAHNPMGALVLASQLKTYLPAGPRILLFSARPDKDVGAMMEALAPHIDRVIVTAIPDTPMPDLEVLSAVARQHGAWVDVEPDLEQALGQAREEAGP